MDCNSYSYAPHMLDGEDRIAAYENDDMSAELEIYGKIFTVTAYSYDGSMDIYETFRDLDRARELYNYILEQHSDTPPGGELKRYIRKLQREEARSA